MAAVNVDYQVHMTQFHEQPSVRSIGTDGLGPCVGIIVTKNDGNVFCAHIACSIAATPINRPIITTQTTNMILQHLPAGRVTMVYCATSNANDQSAVAIRNGLVAAYGAAHVSAFTVTNGIYWLNNNVGYINGNQNIVGAVQGPNADNGPMDVQAP